MPKKFFGFKLEYLHHRYSAENMSNAILTCTGLSWDFCYATAGKGKLIPFFWKWPKSEQTTAAKSFS